MTDNIFNIPNFNGLSYSPQMPYAQLPGMASVGQQRNPIQAGNPLQNQPGNPMQTNPGSNYTMQPSWQFGLNYNQIAFSNAVQGIGGFLKQNNQRKDFNSYNRVQKNPLSQLPENPNTSEQSLYGMQQYKKGGLKRYDDGGPGDKVKPAGPGTPVPNYYDPTKNRGIVPQNGQFANQYNNINDLDTDDAINSAIGAGGNPMQNKFGKILGQKSSMDGQDGTKLRSMIDAISIYNQRPDVQSLNPQDRVKKFYQMQGEQNPDVQAYRQRGIATGSYINYLNNNSKDRDIQKQLSQTTAPSNSTATSYAEGGRFDNFDDFDEDDFDDLKDELDNYFKDKNNPKAEEQKPEETKQEDKQESPEQEDNYRPSGALDFLNTQQPEESDDKDDDQTEGQISPSDKALSDGLVGKTALPKPQLNPSIYAGKPTDDLTAFKKGIAQVENAGYQEGNKNSSAFGKYQFTAPTRENVREQYFKDINKTDFENAYKSDPQFQERVMDVYSNHLLQTYKDPHQAALAFYLGPGKANYTNQPDYNPGGGNVSVGKYLSTFDKGYSSKKQGGHIMNAPGQVNIGFDRQRQIKEQYKQGGEYEMSDAQIALLRKQGYQIDII